MPKLIPLLSRALILAMLSCGGALADESRDNRRIMTWVPPYALSECKERLQESFDGTGMKDGITHLGLQFWNPTETGGIELVTRFREKISDETIAEFRDWGKKHDIKIMLCVYNGTSAGWDWELAKSAFKTHRAEFVDALVRETVRLKFDGVDIDFEGKGGQEESREPFLQFIRELSSRLHAQGKELTVDTFAYKWNAPNQSWWPDLLPHIDGLHVMGYAATGADADDWRSYNFIKGAAGRHASKLLIGMPGNAFEWQEKSARKHLDWFVDHPDVGLAIWDARLKHPNWRTKETWQTITRIKNGAESGRNGVGTRSPHTTGRTGP